MKLYNRARLNESEKARVERHYNSKNQEIDPNTKQPLKEGQIDYGHKYGVEERAMQKAAKQAGLTQKEYTKMMKNPDLYQREDRHQNRSHKHECKNPTIQYMKCTKIVREFKIKNKDSIQNKEIFNKNSQAAKTSRITNARTLSGKGTLRMSNSKGNSSGRDSSGKGSGSSSGGKGSGSSGGGKGSGSSGGKGK